MGRLCLQTQFYLSEASINLIMKKAEPDEELLPNLGKH